MLKGLSEHGGAKPRSKDFTPLTTILYEQGYVLESICKELGISPRHYYKYFQNPDLFSLARCKVLSWMANRPLGDIINMCTEAPKRSRHWFTDNSPTVEQEITNIKRKTKLKPPTDES